MNQQRNNYKSGRLTATVSGRSLTQVPLTGVQSLTLDAHRDGVYYIPATYTPENPARVVLMLHGAGGQADHGLSYLRKYADDNNLIIIAPASLSRSWDIIMDDEFGRDVQYIDQSLTYIFDHYSIDRSRIGIGGFSDGASYALCLGLINGDVFSHVLAFSPGFYHAEEFNGKPAIFISHGVHDRVLPVHACSRKVVAALEQQHYSITYKEFEGEHEIPASIATAAIAWFFK